jgi:hypothetical protein
MPFDRRALFGLLLLVAACAQQPAPPPATGAPAVPALSADAAAALRRMTNVLQAATTIAFRVDVLREVRTADGRIATLAARDTVVGRKPDRLRADLRGDAAVANVFFDGQRVVLEDEQSGFYAVADSPPTIDGAVALLSDRLGVPLPLSVLLRDDAYAQLTANASGEVLSESAIGGIPALHLRMRTGDIDWETWLEREGRGLPLLTILNRDGRRTIYRFTEWRFDPRINDSVFRFTPAPGAHQIPFAPLRESAR